MLGILLIHKPKGITSHDAVNIMRRKLGTRRVGHAGTLDPLATGLLIVAVGPATRFLQYLPLEPKEYFAEIRFGRSTTTYDSEGEPSEPRPCPGDLRGALDASLPQFLGLIQQLPPMHSAVKVGGKPLYSYARQGREIRREPRTVHISNFDLLEVGEDFAKARIVCSGGTYVRSLAHDLGEAVGCGAFLSALERTRVGKFELCDAVDLDAAGSADLMPLKQALEPMPSIALGPEETHAIREGRDLSNSANSVGLVALLDPAGAVFSVARVDGNRLRPECVIPAEAT